MVHSISRAAQGQLAPIYDVRQTFLSYFPYRYRTIFKNFDGNGWFTINNNTPLTDELLIEAVSDQKKCFRGLRWGSQTRFAVLDIDDQSTYHNAHSLVKIKQALATIGITGTACYQSSISTGWHMYIPFLEWEQSDDVANSLKGFLRLKGFHVTSGTLEVFPSGAGLRLPLQFGFAWLDGSGQIVTRREDLGADEAMRRFVHDIESGGNDWTYTKSRITEELEIAERARREEADRIRNQRLSEDGFEDLFQSRLIVENYERGKKLWREGLTQRGERHDAVICVEHYLWHGDSEAMLPARPGRTNDEERARLIRQWLERKHNGCCRHIDAGDWKTVDAQIERACKWRAEVIPERVPYLLVSDRAIDRITVLSRTTSRTWTPEDWQKGNEKRRVAAREKIATAVETLTEQGRKVTGRLIAEMTGCSRNTVRRHADLWLQCGSGDLEPGGFLDPVVFSLVNENEIDEIDIPKEPEIFDSVVIQLSLIRDRNQNLLQGSTGSRDSGVVFLFSGDELTQGSPEEVCSRSLDLALQNSCVVSCALEPLEAPQRSREMDSYRKVICESSWRHLEGCPASADSVIDSRIDGSGSKGCRPP